MSTLTNTNKAAGAYRFGSSGDEYRTKGRSVRGPNWRAPAYGGHDPNDKQFASKVFGDIARKDWADYQNTFMPVHGEFKDAVMSDDLTLEQLDRIPGIVNNSFDKREQAADASANRMGLQALEHDSSHSRGLAEVFAENQARVHGKERRNSAIVGANISSQNARVNQ